MSKKLCFWNDGAPKVVNSKHVAMPDGSDRFYALADPDSDLYDYEEVNSVRPSRYHTSAFTLDNDGWTVTKTYTWTPVDISIIRDGKKGQARAQSSAVLNKDDWQTTRETEEPTKKMPKPIRDWRKAVRDYNDAYDVAVNIETDVDTLIAMQPDFPSDPRGL